MSTVTYNLPMWQGVTLPRPAVLEVQGPSSTAALTEEEAEQLLQQWQTIKAQALGDTFSQSAHALLAVPAHKLGHGRQRMTTKLLVSSLTARA